MRGRVIRRPIGGWAARQWRYEVWTWFVLSILVVSSWQGLNLLVAALRFLSDQ